MQVNRTIQLAGRMPENGKFRVAAYCRVSTELESQQTSIELQQLTYEEMIRENPVWELAGIYADQGASGTQAKNRQGFTQMIADAEAGKIDYVITKSISRFARNTLECLQYVRHLKSLGVQMFFEKENIDTGAAFSEMLLTILAAFAQEESRSISENVKLGIRMKFQSGEPRWANCYGYKKEGDEEYIIVPEEAEVVKLLFGLYERGYTVNEICEYLEENQIPTPKGSEHWYRSVIQRMLKNEKYVGDVRMQKNYRADHLTHQQYKNNGKLPDYYVSDHHTPIVSRKTYDRAAKIREMRNQGGGHAGSPGNTLQYPFDEMLKCPYCGGTLHRKKVNVQGANGAWCCDGCGKFIIRASFAEDALAAAYNAVSEETVLTLPDTAEKKLFLTYKQEIPFMERTDYFWLDDLVDHIEFGKHSFMPSDLAAKPELLNDNTVTVYWKAGIKCTVPTGIQKDKDMPGYIAALYSAYLERQELKAESA